MAYLKKYLSGKPCFIFNVINTNKNMFLTRLKNKSGQAVCVEYALVFFLIVAFVSAMTVYVRRTVQGRIRDARLVIVNELSAVTAENFTISYEPYYAVADINRGRNTAERRDQGAGSVSVPEWNLLLRRVQAAVGTTEQLSPRVLEGAP